MVILLAVIKLSMTRSEPRNSKHVSFVVFVVDVVVVSISYS